MFVYLFSKFLKKKNVLVLDDIQPIINTINKKYLNIIKISNSSLKLKTKWLKYRLKQGENLDKILVEAFATVKEASRRTLGETHYNSQIIGGLILHKCNIAEMKTGEGKTLVSTLPVYLNALEGKGVHIVTVNDYLAKRDSDWMGQIYRFLGLTVGCLIQNISEEKRKAAYKCDITYGTNNEFGFDYLRDNMKFSIKEMVQRPFNFALIDEVDNILIDEARTPLIISGPAEESSKLYYYINKLIPLLRQQHYEYEEKDNSVNLTEIGSQYIEDLIHKQKLIKKGNLYDKNNLGIIHHVIQALKAHIAYQKEKDYIVKNDKIVIIDEFTGRMMEGRRYADGLHQALEAKEGVKIQLENQTLASITFQNYFKLYPKLSGMTGTAVTEAEELLEIYNLNTIIIPTNKKEQRIDYDDEIYKTNIEKYNAIVKLIKQISKKQQPVLVGTTSIKKSEYISNLLIDNNIKHKILNARYHEKEAQIIIQAGSPNAVTIATNMAGRGTDIQLGGYFDTLLNKYLSWNNNKKKLTITNKIIQILLTSKSLVIQSGGLYVIGTERHESRRIDNQLRGRSGRQGDPGKSKFFLSLDDDLMRIFTAKKQLNNLLTKLGVKQNEPITDPIINKSIEKAQQKVEGHNFEIRKQIIKFDNVINQQRQIIYKKRNNIIMGNKIHKTIIKMRSSAISQLTNRHIPKNTYVKEYNLENLKFEFLYLSGLQISKQSWSNIVKLSRNAIKTLLLNILNKHMDKKTLILNKTIFFNIERNVILRQVDNAWKEHLRTIDNLKQCIHLRAYGQRDPLNEFQSEAFLLFTQMIESLNLSVTKLLSYIKIEESIHISNNTPYLLKKIQQDKQ